MIIFDDDDDDDNVLTTLQTGKLIRLSQQQLVDCSWGEGNNGCDGGEDFRAYQWIMKHGGLASESSYGPYLGSVSIQHLHQHHHQFF